MKRLMICLFCFLSMQGFAQRQLLTEDQYKEYIPIDPVEYTEKITYYESDGTEKKELIAKLKDMKKNAVLLNFITDMVSITTITTRDDNAELKYLVNSYSQKNRSYTITTCWFKCRTLSIIDENGNKIGEALLGVGVRLKANITTKEKNLNLSEIFSAGAAVSAKKFAGDLAIYSVGLSGKEVTAVAFTSDKFDETTAMEALKNIETMKLKVYDSDVVLEPKIVAIRKLTPTGGPSVQDIKLNLLPSSAKYKLQ